METMTQPARVVVRHSTCLLDSADYQNWKHRRRSTTHSKVARDDDFMDVQAQQLLGMIDRFNEARTFKLESSKENRVAERSVREMSVGVVERAEFDPKGWGLPHRYRLRIPISAHGKRLQSLRIEVVCMAQGASIDFYVSHGQDPSPCSFDWRSSSGKPLIITPEDQAHFLAAQKEGASTRMGHGGYHIALYTTVPTLEYKIICRTLLFKNDRKKIIHRFVEQMISENLHMNLATSNMRIRHGSKLKTRALQKEDTEKSQTKDEKQVQEILQSWARPAPAPFNFRSRAVSVTNYRFNPTKLRDNLTTYLQSLAKDENLDQSLPPRLLCQQVAQETLDACRKGRRRSPSSAQNGRSSTAIFTLTQQEDRGEKYSYLKALGVLPEGILAKFSLPANWDSSFYCVEEDGYLSCSTSNKLGEPVSVKVCNLAENLLAVQLGESRSSHFEFRFVLENIVLCFAAPTEEERDSWVSAAKLFIVVPEILQLSESYAQQYKLSRASKSEKPLYKRSSSKLSEVGAKTSSTLDSPTLITHPDVLPRPSSALMIRSDSRKAVNRRPASAAL